ncbi:hypothetical protein PG985_000552 [Apiospora marii]|uniref:Cysteine-rich transmembrane domain-containing protein n=1 Tax=Apiospora marii TaxID=335849 RepID=A0ABR1R2H2_9PEZI
MSQQGYYQQGPPPQGGYPQGPYPPPQQPMYYQQQPPPPQQQEKSHGCLYGCLATLCCWQFRPYARRNILRPRTCLLRVPALRAILLDHAADPPLPAQQGEPPLPPADLDIEVARIAGAPSHARVVRLVVGVAAGVVHKIPLLLVIDNLRATLAGGDLVLALVRGGRLVVTSCWR